MDDTHDTIDQTQDTATRSRPWRRRPFITTAASALAAGLMVAFLFATGVIGGASYPHPWCAPVLAALHTRSGTQSYETVLMQAQRNDHAPLGKPIADLHAYDATNARQQNASTIGRMTTVASDLQALNRACGQSPNAYKSDTF